MSNGIAKPRILLVQAVDYDTRTLVGFLPLCTPVSVATIAALTSPEFDVDIWDENFSGLIDETTRLPHAHYDILGISALFEHVGHRVPTLAGLFRRRGTYICAGGPGISNQFDLIRSSVDSVFLNEAEYTWPAFLKDWSNGAPKPEYVQIAKPALTESPAPRWDAIASTISQYRAGGVQTTRGCPFDCEFCDVIYLYGRAQRHKHTQQVLGEVSALQRLGARRVFFTDDEFIGDPKYARALLTDLVSLNNSFRAPLAFHTQLTLNLSRHLDILDLMADANFWHALIGIESFNEESLEETNKLQNTRRDIVADCRKILSHGVGINGSLIVGFDHDGPDVFGRIVENVQKACIPFASASILRATHGTKLWTRLKENKRLWRLRDTSHIPQSLQVDIMPGGSLSRSELIEGRIHVNKELSKVTNLCARLNGWIQLLERVPMVNDPKQLSFENARKMVRANESLVLDEEETRLLDDTLDHVRQRAPVMMGRVVDSIFAQLYWYRIRTHHTDEELRTVLAAEKAGDLVPDDTPVTLTSAFAAAFRRNLFARVYDRLYELLPDTKMIPEAASEVFVDYMVRLRAEADCEVEDTFSGTRYDDFLFSLCDRTATRLTGREERVERGTADAGALPPSSGLKRTGLRDAVLKEVGDRLARLNA